MQALLIIDMQNEFLSPMGMFGPKAIPSNHLISNLAQLVHAFRSSEQPIVWVRAVYSDWTEKPAPKTVPRPDGDRYQHVPQNDDFLASAHFGREACCVRGEKTADFYGPVLGLIEKHNDLILEKRWYSSFTDTPLLSHLQQHNVDELIVCGVATNVCVTATSVDAFFLGFEVSVISDATNATSAKRHEAALQKLSKWYGQCLTTQAQVRKMEEASGLSLRQARLPGLAAGDSFVLFHALPHDLQDCFHHVKEEISWHQMELRGNPVPRMIALQGTIEDGNTPIYRHPADSQPELVPWTSTSARFKEMLAVGLEQNFNHALIQYYENGESWISPHTDKTLDIEHNTNIVNLSLGATRTMTLRSKKDKMELQEIALPHGSVFVLGPKSNARWFHSIKKDKRPKSQKTPDELLHQGQRISFTFRTISTFQDRAGALFGQGAKRKQPGEPKSNCQEPEHDQARQMLAAFGLENRTSHFNWEENYGGGFDVLYLRSLRATEAQRTLYWVNGSIPSWRVMLALAEKGLTYEEKRLKVMSQPKETKSPEFLQINPRGTTPALVDIDNTIITESLAILHYLERFYPTPSLLPALHEKSAYATTLARIQESENLRKAYRPIELLFVRSPEDLTREDKERLQQAVLDVRQELTIWEGYVREHPFVAGPQLTLADCAFYPALAYQLRRGLQLMPRFPHLLEYCLRMQERESVMLAQPKGWKPGKVGKNLFSLCASLGA